MHRLRQAHLWVRARALLQSGLPSTGFRLRHLEDREVLRLEATRPLRRRAGLLSHSVYECPRCEERYLGLRRCPECNLMCRRLGLGGECPHCAELVLLAELVTEVDL